MGIVVLWSLVWIPVFISLAGGLSELRQESSAVIEMVRTVQSPEVQVRSFV